MSTSENPETPPLTRRQLRELRNTGATPIITPRLDEPDDDTAVESGAATPAQDATAAEATPEAAAPAVETPAEDAPAEAAPADEQPPAPEPPAKKGGMLGGLFGRGKADRAEPAPEAPAVEEPSSDDVAPESPESDVAPTPEPPLVPATFGPASDAGDLGVTGLTRRQARAQERIRTASVPIIAPDLQPGVPAPIPVSAAAEAPASEHPVEVAAAEQDASAAEQPASVDDEGATDESRPAIFRPSAPDEAPADQSAPEADDIPVSTVNPALGSDLLNGETPEISLPPSFDQLIARGPSTGSVSTPNALILSQTPAGVPLVGPVTATGEVLITGTFELPEGLGSAGHAPGTTDGRDVDAVLLDGELPPASSPTPIAASAAISTVKQPGEIIRPPAPEKGSKLVIGLIITTGALAVAVAVALVLAFTTGVFG